MSRDINCQRCPETTQTGGTFMSSQEMSGAHERETLRWSGPTYGWRVV
jgi:hypothetical protein